MVAQYAQAAARIGTVSQRSFLHPRAIFTIASLLRRWNVDVVHTCLYLSDAGGIIAARLAGVPRIVSHLVGHNFYVTDERGWRRVRQRCFSWVYRGVYALADQLVAVSDAVRRDLAGRPGIKVPSRKIVVIHHSLPDRESPCASGEDIKRLYAVPEGAFLIAAIASLIPLKGHRYLLEAIPAIARTVPDLRCLIVGDGPSRPLLEALVDRLRIRGHVVFTGVLADAERNAVLRSSHVVVLPSLSEGLPVVVLEAMAFGKPIVATRVGGVPELIEHDVSGILVPPQDSAALAEAILAVASNGPKAEQLGRAARLRFDERFSFDEMRNRLRAIYLGAPPPEANAA